VNDVAWKSDERPRVIQPHAKRLCRGRLFGRAGKGTAVESEPGDMAYRGRLREHEIIGVLLPERLTID